MDKYSVMRQAVRLLGERELVPGSATYAAVAEAYEVALRRCNGRHHWTFARVLGRKVEAERMHRHGEAVWYALPLDCMRMIEARWGDGRKVRRPQYGVRVGEYERGIMTDERPGEAMYLTYTADMLKLGENVPDCAPMFVEAVKLLTAAEASAPITGAPNVRGDLVAMAEDALKEAIVIDRRQDASNDRLGLGGEFWEGDVLGLTSGGAAAWRTESETHY